MAHQTPSGTMYIDVVDQLTNIAPIMDAVITGLDSNDRVRPPAVESFPSHDVFLGSVRDMLRR